MVAGDLWDQSRVLYVLYAALNEQNKRWLSIQELGQDENLEYVRLGPVLFYLESGEFVQVNGSYYAFTAKGLKTIISLFQKFVLFIKQEYPERLAHWIGQFDININNNWPRTRDVFFFINTEPEVEKAFIDYLTLFGDLDDIDKLDVSGGFYLPRGYTYLRNECTAFFSDNSKYSGNTFIMTKFDKLNAKLNDTIDEVRKILDANGYKATRAHDKMYMSDRDMWNNVCVYMLCCKQGGSNSRKLFSHEPLFQLSCPLLENSVIKVLFRKHYYISISE